MINSSVTCVLIGEYFKPEELEGKSNLLFEVRQEKGGTGRFGRYKGKSNPYGSAILIYNSSPDSLEIALEELQSNYQTLKSLNVEQILLTLNIAYEDQCNFDIEKESIKKLAQMDIDFSVSCYENKNTDCSG